MQTFLPYADLDMSARSLDKRRLGKQRVEALQIINTLQGASRGWRNHPAVRMWEGHIDYLRLYFNAMSREWIRRGCVHNLGFFDVVSADPPAWLGDERLHSSHRAALLFKELDRGEPEWYIKMPWIESPRYDYWWPSVTTSSTVLTA